MYTLYEIPDEGKAIPLATISNDGKEVKYLNKKNKGMIDKITRLGEVLTPKDGKKYLEALIRRYYNLSRYALGKN